jgi:hypothetical protein
MLDVMSALEEATNRRQRRLLLLLCRLASSKDLGELGISLRVCSCVLVSDWLLACEWRNILIARQHLGERTCNHICGIGGGLELLLWEVK